MSIPHTLERLRSSADSAFEDFYRIYVESIVGRERKPRAWICEMVARTDYVTLVLKGEGQVVGFSIMFLPESNGFGLLEYMAIASGRRNLGLGGELFRRSMQTAAQVSGKPVPVLLEVDSDREDAGDRLLRKRRQQFYRRLGCLGIAELKWILPLPGTTPPPEMDLLVYPPAGLRSIAKKDLEQWIKLIYRLVYNCPPDDARITLMVRTLPDPVAFE